MIPNNIKVIGLTGGIASGKSTVTNILKDEGFLVIDADKIARKIVEINQPGYNKIVENFGEDILKDDKTIDRKKLGEIVFNDEEKRKILNQSTHPYIFKEILLLLENIEGKEDIVFLDIPLLFEEIDQIKEYGIHFHEIWLVYVDESTQLKRLIDRDLLNEEEALRRIKSQLSMEEKKINSHRIIDNRGTINQLKYIVDKELSNLR